jgi:hypothetical protein
MDWSGEWWVVILGPGLVFLVIGILYFTRSRAFTFRSAAAQLGFVAFQGPNPSSAEVRKGFDLFSRGSDGKTANMFADHFSTPSMLLFDFSYQSGLPPQAGARFNQTVAAFAVHLPGVPDFQMTAATALDGPVPAPPAIHLDSHPDFARKYRLRAADEAAVRAFFSGPFLDRLTASDPAATWSVEKAGPWLIVYHHNLLFPPKTIPESWQFVHELANLFLAPR